MRFPVGSVPKKEHAVENLTTRLFGGEANVIKYIIADNIAFKPTATKNR